MLIAVIILGAVSQLYAEPKKTFSANAIAFSTSGICLNGNVYADILIERTVQKLKEPKFLVIRTSVPCAQWQAWLISLNSCNQFNVFHSKATVTKIQEYETVIDATPEQSDGIETIKIPIWIKLPNYELFQIPYGTSVLTYKSADWPVVPVL